MNLHPQFITDIEGKRISVILSVKEYSKLVTELYDKQEDIRLFDEAKKTDNGDRILLKDYLKKRNTKNGTLHRSIKQTSLKAVR